MAMRSVARAGFRSLQFAQNSAAGVEAAAEWSSPVQMRFACAVASEAHANGRNTAKVGTWTCAATLQLACQCIQVASVSQTETSWPTRSMYQATTSSLCMHDQMVDANPHVASNVCCALTQCQFIHCSSCIAESCHHGISPHARSPRCGGIFLC